MYIKSPYFHSLLERFSGGKRDGAQVIRVVG